uniref:sodium/potassium/calcium exchanger 3-like isoform X3 n=1 Tax=Doryrhamphus excisus TaxID=161450 RepID=UPI0025AE477D|nr:sodium/potassium/calcium exchanger 3-like isoform X3 [Doryrhamphus excisus]
MDVLAGQGMSLPAIRLRSRPVSQKKMKTRRKRRKEFLLIQICLFAGLLLVVKGCYFLAGGSDVDVSSHSTNDQERWNGRRLLQNTDNGSTVDMEMENNCTSPALQEFPADLFTNRERTEGAVALHVLCTIYMFCALALVCDDYFVPSLEKICEAVKLSHWAVLRDSVYYTFSVIALIAFIYDEMVCWWESLVLVLMYAIYILIMKFNNKVQCYLNQHKKSSVKLVNGLTGSADLADVTCDATAVLLKTTNIQSKPSVVMVDELLSAYPHQLTFSEAGMRIMITSHFTPRTRLTMASRMLINERRRLINTTETRVNCITNGDSDSVAQGRWGLENGVSSAEPGFNGRWTLERLGSAMENESEDNENNGNDGEGEADDGNEGPLVPFKAPDGVCNKLKWLTMWPLSLLLFFTVPNCAKRRWENWFLVSFFTATIWIAGLSYIMVWMVTVIGFTLGIPDVIMGITFLAAGTSVPDCMASVIVARQGPSEQQGTHLLCRTLTGLSLLHSPGSPFEQMDSGLEIGLGVPGDVRHLSLFLCPHRVQRLHLCQPSYVPRHPLTSGLSTPLWTGGGNALCFLLCLGTVRQSRTFSLEEDCFASDVWMM